MTDETPWNDDRVRWAEDFAHQEERRRRRRRHDKTKNGTSDDSTVHNEEDDGEEEEDEDGEEEKAFLDPFKDPDPFETFDFTFGPNKQQKDDGEDGDHTTTIRISLRGYKKDSDQVWQSTGVTLWRASEHLCHYLVNQPTDPPLLEGKRILEVRPCSCAGESISFILWKSWCGMNVASPHILGLIPFSLVGSGSGTLRHSGTFSGGQRWDRLLNRWGHGCPDDAT